MSNELLDSLKIVCRKFLNIIVARPVNIIGWVFVDRCCIQLLSVIKGDNFVSPTVHYIHRTVDVFDTIRVWKLIER